MIKQYLLNMKLNFNPFLENYYLELNLNTGDTLIKIL